MRYYSLLLAFLLVVLLGPNTYADYRDEFERGFLTKTWSGEQPEVNFCIECHSSDKMKSAFQTIAEEWKASWHAQNQIACQDCHGGDAKDASMSMSPHRGFLGTPKYTEVPEFCGKCHVRIMKSYLESGHGSALRQSGKGPNCVTCHGSHNIQKASLEIINEQRCTKCHSYERAREMKQAMFLVEKKIVELEASLRGLKQQGVVVDDDVRNLFSLQADFRYLFHTVDANLVKENTDEFVRKLSAVEKRIAVTRKELQFRKNYAGFILLTFIGIGIVFYLRSSRYGQ